MLAYFTAGLLLGGILIVTSLRKFRWLLAVSFCLSVLGGVMLWASGKQLETPIRNQGFSVESWLNLMDTFDTFQASTARAQKTNGVIFFVSAGLTMTYLILSRPTTGKDQQNTEHLTHGSTEPGESASVPCRTPVAPGR